MALDLLHDFGRVDGDGFGDVVSLVDAHHLLSQVEHVIPQRDDDELAVLGLFADVLANDSHVLIIQGCVNLVHAVERRRLVEMKREYQA